MALTKATYAMIDGAVVNVFDYGATGDNSTDDTAAIQAAIDSGAHNIYFPEGKYKVTTLTIPEGVAVTLFGDNSFNTRIITTVATGDVLTVDAWYSQVINLGFNSSVQRTSGSMIVLNGAHCKVDNVRINNNYIGIKMVGVACRITNSLFEGSDYPGFCQIWATGGDTSQIIDNCLIGGSSFSYGIQIDNSSALIISNTSVLQTGACLRIFPTTGQSVFSLKAVSCFFDTATRGISIVTSGTGGVYRCHFTDCWTSSMSSHGVIIDTTSGGTVDGIDFVNHESHLNGDNGFTILGTNSINIRITASNACENESGFYAGTGVTKFYLRDFYAGATDGLSGNNYGVFLNGTNSNYAIENCTCQGNTTAQISGYNGSLVTTKSVKNVLGYPTHTHNVATITAGSTSVSVSHGLSGTPNSVLISPLGDPATVRWWTQQSSWNSSTFTISQSGTLGYNQPYSWEAWY